MKQQVLKAAQLIFPEMMIRLEPEMGVKEATGRYSLQISPRTLPTGTAAPGAIDWKEVDNDFLSNLLEELKKAR